MKNIVIAPVGNNMDALFVGIREFPTEKVILVSHENMLEQAEKAKKDLERFKIPVDIIRYKGNIWLDMFKTVSEFTKKLSDETKAKLLINVATGDRHISCAATSAAFVNGIKAFHVDGDQVMVLPVMRFNYYKLISDKKMKLLELLEGDQCCDSLEELSKESGMSLPLVAYHINGGSKTQGLKDMGLVETEEIKGRVKVRPTDLGRMILKGYIQQEEK